MVLGDGTAALAPAHRLSPAAPGSAWVVEEDGTLDRVRADYWPDHLVRAAATTYPALVVEDPTEPDVATVDPEVDGVVEQPGTQARRTGDVASMPSRRAPRSPRRPRQPRAPRTDPRAAAESSASSGDLGPEAA